MKDPLGAWLDWMEGLDNVTVFFLSFFAFALAAIGLVVGVIAGAVLWLS